MAVRSFNPFSRMSGGLWFVPLMCVLAGVGLSLGTIAIDKACDYELIPQSISGGPDAALEILGTVAASMVSLAALVLTVPMVVVQLAMGQFSPRIVQQNLAGQAQPVRYWSVRWDLRSRHVRSARGADRR